MSGPNIPELISEFHTLEGNYLIEKQRSFGRYLTKVTGLLRTKEDQLSFIKTVVPQSRTEELFRVQILLHYKCMPELWNILFCEDVQLMAKIFRAKWFFKEGFVDITPEVLVKTTFSKVSYLVRMRILNKLNLYLGDEIRGDLYFEAVMDYYGLIQASVLLTSCSIEFILNKINVYNIRLKEVDLIKLYKRDSTFPEQYFALMNQNERGIHNYSGLLKHLALHNTEKFWQLKHDFDLDLLLGRKQSTKVLRLYKPLIMQNIRYYYLQLNLKSLMAHISRTEFTTIFFKELFPLKPENFNANSVDSFDGGLFIYLKKLDKSLWLPLIEQTYYSAYKENFRNNSHLITPAILQLMPTEERSKYADLKMAEDNNERWICYYATEKAIGLIKNKINLTTQIPQRSQYIKMLVTTCKINNDKAALLEVLKYFENRHKNDDVQLKTDFLFAIQQSFEINKLSMEHIKLLLNIMKLFNVKHGSWFWGASSILAKIIKHHVDNNIPLRDALIFYFKVERRRDIIDLFNKSPKQTKIVLLAIADMIEDLSIAIHAENDDKWAFYACYVNSLIRWNNEHKKDQITLSRFPFVATFFHGIAGNVIYDSSLVRYIKATNYDLEIQNLLCNTYWKSIAANKDTAFYCSETDWWFAKNKVHYIFENAEIIFSNRYCNFHNFQKFVNNADICENFAEKAVEIISNHANIDTMPADDVYKYKKALFVLAHNPQYMNLVKPYFPPENATVNADDDSKIYSFRTSIVKGLESIRQPSSTLETMLLFLKGDYLHSSLSTLYKISQNTPPCYLADFLRILSNRAVSVRKHAIFLNATLMNTDAIYDMLAKSGEKENNPSLRKFILTRTLKYFLEDGKCNESFWQLLKVQLFLLNADDTEGHKQLLVLRKIPFKYQSEYVEALWQLFSMSQNKTVNDLRLTLLGSIHEKLFPCLPNLFCDEVIKYSVGCQSMESSRHEFIFNCLLYGDEKEILPRLDCVFGLFRNFLKKSEMTNGACRAIVQDFIVNCCSYLVYKKKDENYAALVNILEILQLKWSHNFTCLVAFHQCLILNLTAIYFECSRNKFESVIFVQKLGVMFDNMVDNFGDSIIQLFSNIAREFLRIICVTENLDNDECLLHTLDALSINHKHSSRLILVINTLPIKIAKTSVLKTIHLSILESLRLSANDAVQIHLTDYLTKLRNN